MAAGANLLLLVPLLLPFGTAVFSESPVLQAYLADRATGPMRDMAFAVYFTFAFGIGAFWAFVIGIVVDDVRLPGRLRRHGRRRTSPPRSCSSPSVSGRGTTGVIAQQTGTFSQISSTRASRASIRARTSSSRSEHVVDDSRPRPGSIVAGGRVVAEGDDPVLDVVLELGEAHRELAHRHAPLAGLDLRLQRGDLGACARRGRRARPVVWSRSSTSMTAVARRR